MSICIVMVRNVLWMFYEELKIYSSFCIIVIIWCILLLFFVMFMGKRVKERCVGLFLARFDYSSGDVFFLIKVLLFFMINSESNGNYIEEGR